jgi:hypothetical protein
VTNLPTPTDWICPTCQHANSPLEYCPACGEPRLHPHRLTLTGVAEQAVESLFHSDSRIPRTLKTLVLQPGRITQAWAYGERRPWMAPFQLFLFLNIVFYFAQSVAGINLQFPRLESHLNSSIYSPLAQKLMKSHLDQRGGTVAELTSSFDHQQRTNSKLLVLAMVPAFALMLRLAFPMRRLLDAVHVVFSLHFYAFLMICISLLFLLVSIPTGFLMRAYGASIGGTISTAIDLINVAFIAIYLWRALRRVYSLTGIRRAISVVLLTAAVWPILMAYQLFVFWVTLREI